MFDFSAASTAPLPKTYFTHSLLPPHIDPAHLPNKKYPFCTISAHPFVHTLDLILPSEIYALIAAKLPPSLGHQEFPVAFSHEPQPQHQPPFPHPFPSLRYARVHMKLSDLLHGPFFQDYIKHGDILMLSEGRPTIDNVFWLVNGVLKMELGRETYERLGWQGVPVEDGGKKHKKARFRIEIDLTSPSMVAGKNGFERLKRGAGETLGGTVTWLFCDLRFGEKKGEIGAIEKEAPIWKDGGPVVRWMDGIRTPRLKRGWLEDVHEMDSSLELLEWLHLVGLESPRVRDGDRIDEFLSRYQVPDFTSGGKGAEPWVVKDLIRVRWRGLISSHFVKEIFMLVRKNGIGRAKDQVTDETVLMDHWFALTATAFAGFGGCYTVMQFVGRETLVWQCD